jgi:hypothetical protein
MARCQKMLVKLQFHKEKKMQKKTKHVRVTHRLVDQKLHTKGYVIDGKSMTRSAAVQLAQQGKIRGVVAVGGHHIQSLPTRKQKLYDLPERSVK